jgi:hypothetical protein
MHKKDMINHCVQYILNRNHERDDLVYRMKHEARRLEIDGLSIPEIRKTLFESRASNIFYIAKCLAHGKRHANNAIRSCIAEAIEVIR